MDPGFGPAVYEVRLKDDFTAKSDKMFDSMSALRVEAKYFGNAFKQAQNSVTGFTVKLKDAKKLFKDTGDNVKVFKALLKDAGVSALDTSLLVGKMTMQLKEQRRVALGMTGLWSKVFNPRTIWVASHALNVLSKGYGVLRAAMAPVFSLAGRAAQLGIAGGKGLIEEIIDSARTREDTMIAFTEMMRGKEDKLPGDGTPEQKRTRAAKDLYQHAVKAAAQTPLDTDQVIEYMKMLTTGGFMPEEVKVLLGTAADQQAKMKTGTETINAFSRMKGRSYITGQDFESLRAAKFQMEPIYDKMADKLGVKDADRLARIAKTKKIIGSRGGGKIPISAETLLNAVLSAQRDQASGQGSGSFALANSKSLSGVISNFKSSFGDLVKTVDVTEWPGIVKLKNLMYRITQIMTDTEGGGGKLLKGIQSFTNELLVGLDRVTDKDIEGFITNVGKALTEIGRGVKEAWDSLYKLINGDKSIADTLIDTLIDVGMYIGAGIWKGVTSGSALLEERKKKRLGGLSEDQVKYAGIDTKAGAPQFGSGTAWMERKEYEAAFAQKYKDYRAAGGKSAEETGLPRGGAWGRDPAADAVAAGVRNQAEIDLAKEGAGAAREMVQVAGALKSAAMAFKSGGIYGLFPNPGTPAEDVVPKMARGGLVDRPTLALIGEAGPEIVAPPRALATFLADIAPRIAGAGGGGNAPVVHLGGINFNGSVDPATARTLPDNVGRAVLSVLERWQAERS